MRALIALLLVACTSSPLPARGERPGEGATPPSTVTGPHIVFTRAAEGDLLAQVRAHVATARAAGRIPLVYVGAGWCEPCGYFHIAAERGDLDAELPPLALLELDRDTDGARIDAAGYGSQMIPMFAVPGDDGRPVAHIEGSIHGPGSPLEIAPRLRAILPER